MASKEDLIKYYASINNYAYLVALSNIGTYKRAQKDFVALNYQFAEDSLIFNIEDFVIVLPIDIKKQSVLVPRQ